jgi:hypothetical protein
MKPAFFSLVALLCLSVPLASCSGGGMGTASAPSEASDAASDSYTASGYADRESAESGESAAGLPSLANGGNASPAEKIIYSAEARIETTDLDASVEKVYEMLDLYDAFIESSDITGGDRRSANFTLRVPRESFTAVTDRLSELGSLLSVSSNAVNIQTQYTDSASRLTTYRTEEERLLSMLASVNDVESMIAIESRLSNVRYEIESLTARLRDWDNQVNYSSVTLRINEVKQLRAQLQAGESYAQELRSGFAATLRGIGAFFMEAFKILVIALPALVLLAVVALLVFFIVKRTRARRAKRAKQDEAS